MRDTTAARLRRAPAGLLGLALAAALSGCSDEPAPEAAVECRPGAIAIELTNVGDRAAAYTVAVEIDRAGLVETERYSSDDVAPGETTTIRDDRPDDQETCTVTSVEVFPR